MSGILQFTKAVYKVELYVISGQYTHAHTHARAHTRIHTHTHTHTRTHTHTHTHLSCPEHCRKTVTCTLIRGADRQTDTHTHTHTHTRFKTQSYLFPSQESIIVFMLLVADEHRYLMKRTGGTVMDVWTITKHEQVTHHFHLPLDARKRRPLVG